MGAKNNLLASAAQSESNRVLVFLRKNKKTWAFSLGGLSKYTYKELLYSKFDAWSHGGGKRYFGYFACADGFDDRLDVFCKLFVFK